MEILSNGKGTSYTGDEMNEIFDIIDVSGHDNKPEYEIIADPGDDEDTENLLAPIVGYKAKVKSVGDHCHDGQMVDYTVTFTSPEGKKTKVETEMCLMVGWNMWGDIIIK